MDTNRVTVESNREIDDKTMNEEVEKSPYSQCPDRYPDNQARKKELSELYTWVDTIPVSKVKKNLTRDFSDAVYVAEILKAYYPRYVELHNYPPANNINSKKENWSTLNRKVLSKLDIKLSKETINRLANAHQGTIEKLLLDLRSRVSNGPPISEPTLQLEISEPEVLPYDDHGEESPKETSQSNLLAERSDPVIQTVERIQVTFRANPFRRAWRLLTSLVLRIVGFLLFWNLLWIIPKWCYKKLLCRKTAVDAATENTEFVDATMDVDKVVPRVAYSQLKQQLREKNDVICTLNHKIAYLESSMKLKELRIANLSSRILQNAVEMDQSQAKPFSPINGQPKLAKQC